MAQLCYKCFCEYEGAVCPRCGYSAVEDEGKYPHALKPGTVLGGRYIVGRVLGQGGFGITYAAQDYESGQIVAIKEFLPESIATRLNGTTVGVFSVQNTENFSFGKEKFLNEAKTLSQFNGLPCICSIYSYFEENGTAYFVMEYVNGVTLAEYLEMRGGALSVEETKQLLIPVMQTLAKVHAQGIIHRDIAPDNIMVRSDGSVVLIDFGAARYSIGEKTRSLTVMLKYGFAPREQYARRSRQGPYTDVYAMAATFYYTITGTVPPDAYERTEGDELKAPRSMGVKISAAEEQALLKGLAPASANRWQTMDEFAAALMGRGKKPINLKLIVAAAVAVIVVCGAVLGFSALKDKDPAIKNPKHAKEPMQAAVASEVIVSEPTVALTATPTATPKPTPTPAPIVASGKEGSVEWELDADGVLYLLGSGSLRNYDQYDRPDWYEHRDKIFYIKMSDSITGIGEYSFADCESLRDIVFSENLKEIPYRAFVNCTSLTELNLPDKIEDLYENAFNGCTSLQVVHFPKNLRHIKAYCFNECDIRTVSFPESLKEIQEYAFYGCDSLRDVVYGGTYKQWKVMDRVITGNMGLYSGTLTTSDLYFEKYPEY